MTVSRVQPIANKFQRCRFFLAIATLTLAPALSGCAARPAEPAAPASVAAIGLPATMEAGDGGVSSGQPSSFDARPPYLLRPGDIVDVKFFYNPELNESVPIRPDGKISLQLIGDVNTLGLSPAQLSEDLSARYASTLRQPEVAVIVKEISSQKVYVGGEVAAPGLFEMERNLTALQAIFQAGGLRETAAMQSVVLLRYQGTREPVVMTLDLKSDLEGAEGGPNDVLLRPYDVVYVPKTGVAKVNQWIRQHFTEIVPITLVLGLNYIWPSTTVLPR